MFKLTQSKKIPKNTPKFKEKLIENHNLKSGWFNKSSKSKEFFFKQISLILKKNGLDLDQLIHSFVEKKKNQK